MLFFSSKCLLSFKRTVLVELKIITFLKFIHSHLFQKKIPGHRGISRIKSLLESVEKLGESLACHQWTLVCVGTPPQPPTAALYTAAKTRKQLRCPSTAEGIEKTWATYTMGLLSHKKNEIVALTGKWMQLKILEIGEKKLDSFAYLC